MIHIPRFRALIVATAILTVASAVPMASAQTEEDAERAKSEAAAAYQQFVALHDEVDSAIGAYEAIRGETFEVEYRLHRLEGRIAADADVAADLQEEAEALAIEAYVNGSLGSVGVALEATTIQQVVTSEALLERANALNAASLDRLEAVTRELDRLTANLEEDRQRLQTLEDEAAGAVERIQLVQRVAEEWYQREDAEAREARAAWEAEKERRRRAEAARRAREAAAREAAAARAAAEASARADREAAEAVKAAAGGTGVYDYLACPQAEPNGFRDTWGARRSGGRTHKGTDIFSSRGTDVYAVTSGTLRTRIGGLGGITLRLFGDDGNSYYYAHLDGWADGVETGTRVAKGDLIAFVGNTGNASGTAPHTHFQLHPDGGSPVNPYPTLSEIC
jgi:murein DD-endopeptidase MepM/ murein hydrolase activator NlpD